MYFDKTRVAPPFFTRAFSYGTFSHLAPFALYVIALALSGCGYTLQGSGSILPADVKKIHIPLVENFSSTPGLSPIFTEAIRERFERFGVVTVVDSLEESDAILQARVVKVTRDSRTTTSNTDSDQELDTAVVVAGELRRITGPVLWRSTGFSVSRAVASSQDTVVSSSADFATGNLGANDLSGISTRELSRGQEQEAFLIIAEETARKIYDEAVAPDF